MPQLLHWHSGKQTLAQGHTSSVFWLPLSASCRREKVMLAIQPSLPSVWAWAGAWAPCRSGWKSPGNSHHKPVLSQEQLRMNFAKGTAIPEFTWGWGWGIAHWPSLPFQTWAHFTTKGFVRMKIPKSSWKRAPGNHSMVIRQTLHLPHPQK